MAKKSKVAAVDAVTEAIITPAAQEDEPANPGPPDPVDVPPAPPIEPEPEPEHPIDPQVEPKGETPYCGWLEPVLKADDEPLQITPSFADVAAACEQITLSSGNGDNNEVLGAEPGSPTWEELAAKHDKLYGKLTSPHILAQELDIDYEGVLTKQPAPLTPPYKCTLQIHAPLAGRLLGGNSFHQEQILASLQLKVVDKQIAVVDGNYVACGAWVIILHGHDIELMKRAVREAVGGLQGDSYFRQTVTLDGGQRYSKVVPYAE